MNENEKVIFCQAPADVCYVLDLFEKTEQKNTISIFVINVEGLYTFLSSLNLNIKRLIYIPYELKNIKNIYYLFKEKSRINKLWETHFKQIKNCDVYFFSRFEDYLTSTFIHRFSRNNTIAINYVNHYDNSSVLYPKGNNTTVKLKIYLLILKFLTGVWFETKIKEKLPEFPVINYDIKELHIELPPNILVKYQYQLSIINNEKSNLLFFISPCENLIFDSTYYYEKLIQIIHLLRELGFNIIGKGHPRLGMPNSIREIVDLEIPSHIPGEFINTDDFNLCLGIETATICHFSKYSILPTYSLIKLFQYSNLELFEIGINYLKQQSDGKMLFCESLNELLDIAKNAKNTFIEK